MRLARLAVQDPLRSVDAADRPLGRPEERGQKNRSAVEAAPGGVDLLLLGFIRAWVAASGVTMFWSSLSDALDIIGPLRDVEMLACSTHRRVDDGELCGWRLVAAKPNTNTIGRHLDRLAAEQDLVPGSPGR